MDRRIEELEGRVSHETRWVETMIDVPVVADCDEVKTSVSEWWDERLVFKGGRMISGEV